MRTRRTLQTKHLLYLYTIKLCSFTEKYVKNWIFLIAHTQHHYYSQSQVYPDNPVLSKKTCKPLMQLL